jgi:hypothetical protein
MRIANCRSCGYHDLHVILDLGYHPIPNPLLKEEDLNHPKQSLILLCPTCALLQVTETVSADVLYRRDYPYFSSSPPPSDLIVEGGRRDLSVGKTHAWCWHRIRTMKRWAAG